jgi:hypothetical protein
VALGGAFWDAGAQVLINQGTNRRWTDTLPAADAWLANGGHLGPDERAGTDRLHCVLVADGGRPTPS